MKKIKVKFIGTFTEGHTFWVKETNKYFEWYKNNPFFRIIKEIEK